MRNHPGLGSFPSLRFGPPRPRVCPASKAMSFNFREDFFRWSAFYGVITAICTTGFALIPLAIVAGRIWYRRRFPLENPIPKPTDVVPTTRSTRVSVGGSFSSPGSGPERVGSKSEKAPSYSAVVSSGDSFEAHTGPKLPPRNRPDMSGFREFPSGKLEAFYPNHYSPSKTRVRTGHDAANGQYKSYSQSYVDSLSRDPYQADSMVPTMGVRSKTSQRASTPFPSPRSSSTRVRTNPADLSVSYNTVGTSSLGFPFCVIS